MNHFVKNIGVLFDPKNHRILRNFSNTLIPRRVDIAEAILIGWEDGPDDNWAWRRHLRSVTSDTADRIRQIPRKILEQGLAVTWPAIQQRIKDPVDVPKFRHALQNAYFSSYLAEYDLRVITSLPYTSHPFVETGNNLAYDYEALKSALVAADIWNLFRLLSARSILDLRKRAEYIRFRDAFDAIASRATGVQEIVEHIYSRSRGTRRTDQRFRLAVERNSTIVVPVNGIVLHPDEIDDVAMLGQH